MNVDLTREEIEVAIRALICANDYCMRANNVKELDSVNALRDKLLVSWRNSTPLPETEAQVSFDIDITTELLK